jgi:type II secretory pathway component PulK
MLCQTSRRGAVLVLAMVCLLVVATIGVALTQLLVEEHRQARQRQYQLQALWLAESAVQRAATQLRVSPDYEGETWQIEARSMGSRWPAEAVIRIEPVESEQMLRRIVVQARYPKRELYGVLQQRQILIQLPTAGESS